MSLFPFLMLFRQIYQFGQLCGSASWCATAMGVGPGSAAVSAIDTAVAEATGELSVFYVAAAVVLGGVAAVT